MFTMPGYTPESTTANASLHLSPQTCSCRVQLATDIMNLQFTKLLSVEWKQDGACRTPTIENSSAEGEV